MNKFKYMTLYFLMLPALLIGTFAMISYGVPLTIWVQNLFIWIVGTVIGSVFLIRNKNKNSRLSILSLSVIFVIFLVLPFCFNDLDGVHRWISVGPINIYVSSIIMPILIIYLWKLILNNREGLVLALHLMILVILVLQPDAGQLTAYASAAAIILSLKINNKMIKIISIILTTSLVVLSWIFLDNLAPVPYVEDILFIVADFGNVWFILSILSLLLLVIPFFYFGKQSIIALSLGVYFSMTIAVTFFGNFPMPIMGYGISPIIGYVIALTLLIKINDFV